MKRWELRREQSEARQAALADCEVIRDQLDAIDRTMAEYFRWIGKTVETMLIDVGFHRHARGQWRRRRKLMLAIDADRYPEGAVPLTQNERLANADGVATPRHWRRCYRKPSGTITKRSRLCCSDRYRLGKVRRTAIPRTL